MLIIDLETNQVPEMQKAMQIPEFAIRTVLEPSGQYSDHPDSIETGSNHPDSF